MAMDEERREDSKFKRQWVRASGAATRSPSTPVWRSHWEDVRQKDRCSEDGRASGRKKRNGREKYSEESEKDPGNTSEEKTREMERNQPKVQDKPLLYLA